MELALNDFTLFINDSEVLQELGGIFIENLQDKPGFHEGVEIPHPSVHKGSEHRCFLQADRNQHILGGDDSQRDGDKPVLAVALLYGRNVHQNQGVFILHLYTGPLFLIQRRPQIVQIDLVFFCHHLKFCSVRIRHHDPGFAFNLGNLS